MPDNLPELVNCTATTSNRTFCCYVFHLHREPGNCDQRASFGSHFLSYLLLFGRALFWSQVPWSPPRRTKNKITRMLVSKGTLGSARCLYWSPGLAKMRPKAPELESQVLPKLLLAVKMLATRGESLFLPANPCQGPRILLFFRNVLGV